MFSIFCRKIYVFSPKTRDELNQAIYTYLNHPFSLHKYPNINEWDVSAITDMSYLFANQTNFNKDISSWNVSNVTNMAYMFYRCYNFNKPLNTWDVSNVTNFSHMFARCYNFNQPLNNWNIRNYEVEDLKIEMKFMFFNCKKFNQHLDKWNINNVHDMTAMFIECYEYESIETFIAWLPKLKQLQSKFIINILTGTPLRTNIERYKCTDLIDVVKKSETDYSMNELITLVKKHMNALELKTLTFWNTNDDIFLQPTSWKSLPRIKQYTLPSDKPRDDRFDTSQLEPYSDRIRLERGEEDKKCDVCGEIKI